MTTVTKHPFLHPNMTASDWDKLTDAQWESLSTQEILDHHPKLVQRILKSQESYRQGKYKIIEDTSWVFGCSYKSGEVR